MWVEALKSGNYRQTSGLLFSPHDGYCCLGVLTDLFLRDSGEDINRMGEKEYTDLMELNSQDELGEMLSVPAMQWAELTEQECKELAHMNDNGDSFEKIAKHIEEHL